MDLSIKSLTAKNINTAWVILTMTNSKIYELFTWASYKLSQLLVVGWKCLYKA